MMTESDKLEFKDTGELVKQAAREEDYFKAMDVALNALKIAISNENKELKDAYLGLVNAVYILLDEHYGSNERRKASRDKLGIKD